MNDVANLLQQILDLLKGWLTAFSDHATNVLNKLNLIEEDTSYLPDIKTDADTIASNTGTIVTPVQVIETNTTSIKNDTTTLKNTVSGMSNQLTTISTNVGSASAFTEDCANNTLDIKDKVVTIASDTTQIRSNSNTVVNDLDKVYEALKWALVNIETEETEEGENTVSFDTDLTEDLVSLKVGLTATQSGTGNPSPDNVRPITGYSSMNLNVNGNNITITLGQTVYGGLLDITNGILTITKNYISITQVQNKSEDATGYFWYGSTSYYTIPAILGLNFGAMCNRLVTTSNLNRTSPEGYYTFFENGIIRWKEEGALSINEYNTYLASNPLEIAYTLRTPIIISLTPEQISTIKGINTITTDTNGNVEVTYKESVKHLLDKEG